MNSKRRKSMCDPKDYAKDMVKQTSHSTQELEILDWSKSNNKMSFTITNNKNISDFLGIRR